LDHPAPDCIANLGDGAVNEQSLSRIPFQLSDEKMILSMARWMKFIGAVKVVSSLLALFVVLVGLIFIGAEMGSGLPGLGKVGRLIGENMVAFFGVGFFALILAVVGIWLGFVLYQAAEDFIQVIRTDAADQDHITAGLIQLTTYFKVSILLAFATVLIAMTAGVVFAIKMAAGS
jgi:hypothetical protein